MESFATGKKRPVVQLAGDMEHGLSSTTRLNTNKIEVMVVYKAPSKFLTVDVYQVPGEPVMVHMICPKCLKTNRITADRKRIEFDAAARNPVHGLVLSEAGPDLASLAETGRLSVSSFECAWEVGGDKHVQGGVHTGASLCRQRLAIENNRAKDA